jgi:hypothetical protein
MRGGGWGTTILQPRGPMQIRRNVMRGRNPEHVGSQTWRHHCQVPFQLLCARICDLIISCNWENLRQLS